jgi:hypothetical protein
MIRKYLVILPEKKGSVENEWRQCLNMILNSVDDQFVLVKLNIFVDVSDNETFIRIDNHILNSLKASVGTNCPAVCITAHPPEKPWKVAVEAGFEKAGSSEIIFKTWNSVPYVVTESLFGKSVRAGGLGNSDTETAISAEDAFQDMISVLKQESMSCDQLVRQWNYIGNILEIKRANQNYQIFNQVRNENYLKHRHVQGYPAATGVGMKARGVKLDFLAFQPGTNSSVIAVDNPDQTRPCLYGTSVLKGLQPPQFERAVLIKAGDETSLLVSGTASIKGQDTIGPGNVIHQTEVTIENINKLADSNKIGTLTGVAGADKPEAIILRVYIKNQGDFENVKNICARSFPGVPLICVEADICRENLLVEIEAEYSA